MKDSAVWFDVHDALHELRRLASVKAFFLEKAWEETFFSRKKFQDFSCDEIIELTEDDVDHYVISRSLEVEMFKQTYLRAHLVMAYGIFEKGLYSLAKHAYRECGHGEPPKRGNIPAFKYSHDLLLHKCDVKDVFKSNEWDKAKQINAIRNVVAHGASLLEDERDINNLPIWMKTFMGISTRPFGDDNSPLKQIWLDYYFVGYTHDIFKFILSGAMPELGDPINA